MEEYRNMIYESGGIAWLNNQNWIQNHVISRYAMWIQQ